MKTLVQRATPETRRKSERAEGEGRENNDGGMEARSETDRRRERERETERGRQAWDSSPKQCRGAGRGSELPPLSAWFSSTETEHDMNHL